MTKPFTFIDAIKPAKFTKVKKIALVTAISLIAVGSLFAFKTVSHSQSDNGPANKKNLHSTTRNPSMVLNKLLRML